MRAPLHTFRSRMAQRMFMAFAACAILPFVAVGGLAFQEISHLQAERSAGRLVSASAGYGMAVITRLIAADEVLRATASTGSDHGTGHALPQRASRFFARVFTVTLPPASSQPPAPPTIPLPTPEQLRAIGKGNSVLLWHYSGNGTVHIYLARRGSRDDELRVAELEPGALWGDPEDFPAGTQLVVATKDGALLHAFAAGPAAALAELQRTSSTTATRSGSAALGPWSSRDGSWHAYRWPAFLRGPFACEPWTIIAIERGGGALHGIADWRLTFPAALGISLLAALALAVWQIRRYFAPVEILLDGTRRLARGEFNAPVDASSSDELGELARSFNSMAASLKHQFETLQTVAEVDRLLLQSSQLERVLDALLPRIASVMGCQTVSVLLSEPGVPRNARVYDFGRAAPQSPVRRIDCDLEPLKRTLEICSTTTIDHTDPRTCSPFLEPLRRLGADHFRLWPLRQGNQLAGVFCLGYDAGSPAAVQLAEQGKEFADRLSVVLANVAHAEQLYRQAHYDPMTQLPNRQLFRDRLAGELARISEGARGALLYIDLDRFKGVNDTGGHDAGDELLRIIGHRISSCIKEGDTVARLGGDEFAVILHGALDPQHVCAVAERILEVVARPITVARREHYIGASIGISMYPHDGASAEELLKNSDIAMYKAKEAGRGRALFYESDMNARVQAWASLEAGLHRALREQRFELHWQPIIAAQGGRVIAAEALLRWTGTSHSPATFVPVAEDSGLIIELGELVLDEALRQLSNWRTRGMSIPAVSVNVSPRQLREPLFVQRVQQCLSRHRLDPPCLQIEITEGAMAESSVAERSLRALAEVGVRLALDDFGTGYSSLSYLRSLPVHIVKIDRSFITDVPTSQTASQLVETIIVMCRTLNKLVIAEGVETPAQLAFLEQRGCDAIQGYLLAAPAPADELATWLATGYDEQRRASAH